MSKILEASCIGNVITSEGVTVPDVTVLSQGTAESEGILLLDKEKAVYLPSSASDVESTLDNLSSTLTEIKAALEKIALTLTSIGAGMTGPTTTPPPTLAADVIVINAKATALGLIKTEVDTLKGNLK